MSDEQGETDADAGAADGPTGDDGRDTVHADADETRADAEEDAPGADGPEPTGNGASKDDAGTGDAGGEPVDDGAATADDGGESDDPPVDAIAERVADADPEAVAAEIVELRETVRGLEGDLAAAEAERDDLEDRLKRKAAEFQNYKKRQEKRRAEVRERATEALVEELLEVRDNLDRALEQDGDADIREGVEATFRQLDEVLSEEGVEAIEPEPGSEVDPTRHEVLLNVESDQPDGTVAEVHRTGYEMAGKVLRPAQVTVSEGDAE